MNLQKTVFKNLKSIFVKEEMTRTPHGYDVNMYNEFHRLNESVQVIEKQIDEMGINDYHDPMTLELQAKSQQRSIIFNRLKKDYYEHRDTN